MPPPSSPLLGLDRDMFAFAIIPHQRIIAAYRSPLMDRACEAVSQWPLHVAGTEDVIDALGRGYKKILYIAGTGEGNSLVIFMPAFYIPKLVIIAVVPLISLMQDKVMRPRDFNIETVAWDASWEVDEDCLPIAVVTIPERMRIPAWNAQ
ncbi:hypothetical protein V8F06_007440 [Rhypophila decipiens]